MRVGSRAIILVLLGAASGGFCSIPADFGFPADPPGVEIIDRDFVRTSDGSALLYAVLYSREGLESMDILSGSLDSEGACWEHLYTWEITFEGTPVHITPHAVIEISECDGFVWLSFLDDFMQYEGRVSLYLVCDLDNGEFTEGWAD